MRFCSTPLWDVNLTWYTTDPDFTPCFHDTALVYLPALYLWLMAPIQIAMCRGSKNSHIPWSLLTSARTGLIMLLLVLSLVDFILELAYGLNEPEESISAILAPVIMTMTFALRQDKNFKFA
jgi:ATP-binding cassette subfamily C (CFTR/MRP) protein 1